MIIHESHCVSRESGSYCVAEYLAQVEIFIFTCSMKVVVQWDVEECQLILISDELLECILTAHLSFECPKVRFYAIDTVRAKV